MNRLLFVAPSAYSLSGLATWLDYLLPGLQAKGWDPVLGLVEGPRHHHPKKYLQEHPFDRTVSIGCRTGVAGDRVRAVRRAIAAVQPSAVLSVNIPDSIVAAAAERERTGRDVWAVMTCHGIERFLFDDMRRLQGALDAAVCTNRLACRLAVQAGEAPPDRVFYAAYGAALPSHVAPQQRSDGRLTIAFVGRLEQPQKRVFDLVDIAGKLEEWRFPFRIIVAGDGPERGPLRELVAARGLLERFDFLGFTTAADLPDRVYQRADALLVTSYWETGPIVIWEAMAHGVAVVTSAYIGSGLEGALIHGRNALLFPVGDVVTAATLLRNVATDPDGSRALVEQGRRMVGTRYSRGASVERWHQVLRQIIVRPPQRGGARLPPSRPAGRLDRWLGAPFGGGLRRWSGRRLPDGGPGGEWPHSLPGSGDSDSGFWDLAAQADRRSATGPAAT